MVTDPKVFFQATDPSTVILYYLEAQHYLDICLDSGLVLWIMLLTGTNYMTFSLLIIRLIMGSRGNNLISPL